MEPASPQPRRRRVSPLTLKILGLNSLALVVLVVGLLFLGDYRRSLIEQQLSAMTTEGQLIAAAIAAIAVGAAPVRPVEVDPESGAPRVSPAEAGTPAEVEPGPRDAIAPDLARPLMRRFAERAQYRAQVFARSGELVVDTRQVLGPGGVIVVAPLPPLGARSWFEDAANWFYDQVVDLLPRERLQPYIELPVPLITDYVDTETALRGETATGIRDGGGGDLILSAAVPIQRLREVVGVVFVTGDDREVQEQVRTARFNILRVFALVLAIMIVASLYLAGTIARPIRLLALAAERMRLARGIGAARDDAPKIPDMRRRDEIGDLAAALRDLTDALSARVDAIERFAADVAHEVKNPLTSLKSALETLERIQDPARRQKLTQIMLDDIARIDRLLGDISTASRLDAELSRAAAEPIDLAAALAALRDLHAATRKNGAPDVKLDVVGPGPFAVRGIEDRLGQVFRNVIANAVSFSPPGGAITVTLAREGAWIVAAFDDDGPGVPEDKREAIFDRFYSERPSGEKFGMHSGLGLAISRQIIAAHGGTISAENRMADGRVAGARFVIRLPAG